MPALNFKEIARPNKATGEQDSFEMFARDFLDMQGYRMRSGPDRGPDGGRDLVAEETRRGVGGQSQISWLVSCKHSAHSGRSVTLKDEADIADRVKANHCKGFLGFYSTLPASSLTRKLEGLRKAEGIETKTFDHEQIERGLLGSVPGFALARRYFPASMQRWSNEHPRPARIFHGDNALTCLYCGRKLLTRTSGVKDLEKRRSGIVVMWEKVDDEGRTETRHVYCCCKGDCDRALQGRYRRDGLIDGWEDIPDLTVPLIYLKFFMCLLNELARGDKYTDEAFARVKKLLLALFPYVSREPSAAEKERVKSLSTIPAYIGGLGR